MSCPQDSYYTTKIPAPDYPNENGKMVSACGACGGLYKYCQPAGKSGSGQPNCCPPGYVWSGQYEKCGYGCNSLDTRYSCLPIQPSMDQTAKLNCCLAKNLPNNSPNGYCATNWCPNSENCQSFMKGYCQGDNLQSNECIGFCQRNLGACDPALKKYCSNSDNFKKNVCGCALPSDQYPLTKFKTPQGISIPVTCDERCDVNNDAIRLAGQQDCKIGAICVVDLKDISIVQKDAKSGIKIDQNCGNSPQPPAPPNPSSKNKKDIYIIIGIVIIIIIILLLIMLL